MKLTLLLVIVVVLSSLAIDSYSQAARLTLNMENSTIGNVLKAIENQSEFRFFYSGEVNTETKASVSVTNKNVMETLDELFRGTGIRYDIYGRQIALLAKQETALPAGIRQTAGITGKVTDRTGAPLPGVTVVVKGTPQGTVTNAEGNYSLSNVPPNSRLVFSFVGMSNQEVLIGNQTTINVTLQEQTIGIDEVVAIGYGTQRRVNLTGSVVTTSGDDILKSQVPNIANALTGRLPGVIINQRSGEPGMDNPTIYVRGRSTTGNSNPLVIIDGVERSGFGQINPNDIESISVLKDASAAIYGARAANGVILISTKKGAVGKPSIELSYNQGFTQPTRNPLMSDSYTYASVMNEIDTREGRTPRYTSAELQKFNDGSDPNYPNTDWYDFFVKDFSPQHTTNLSVNGGTNAFKYFLSIGELSQDGQFKNGTTKLKRYNVRANIEANITDYLKVGLNVAGRFEDKHYPRWSGAIFSHVYLYHPTWTPYWPGTDLLRPLRDSDNVLNWVDDTGRSRDDIAKTWQSTLTFSLDIPWIKGFWIDGSINYDTGYQFYKDFLKPTFVYFKNDDGSGYTRGQSGSWPGVAYLAQRFDESSATTINAKLNYNRRFGNHNLESMAGYEQMEGIGNWLYGRRDGYISTAIAQLSAGSADKNNQSNAGSAWQEARRNYFGRINYDYAGKYMAQFILRYEGSTNFPADNRYGLFPSASIGWRISEEKFMSGLEMLDNLKLRASYGALGNDRVSAFQYLTIYGFGNNYVAGNKDVAGIVQSGVPNPKITWEVAKTSNIGFESTLWKGLLGIEFDLFKTKRENILTTASAIVPDYTGLVLPNENIGIVENKGFELQMSHINNSNTLKYSFAGNVSFSRNKVIFSNEAPAAEPYQYATGRPMGAPLVYKAIGIFKDENDVKNHPSFPGAQPGDIKYEDVNKDGVINTRDRIRTDLTPIPEVVYGFNSSFKYKSFDLNFLLQGQANATIYMASHLAVMSNGLGNFLQWRADDRWTPENTGGTMPRASQEDWNNNTITSTHWAFNAAFLRLKNMEVGYNLPDKICNTIKMQQLRLYVNGDNLLSLNDHIKKLGLDPETTSYWYYPQQRIFNVGVKLTF